MRPVARARIEALGWSVGWENDMRILRGVTAALLSLCQPVWAAAPAAPENVPSASTLNIVDARPSQQRTEGYHQLSYWVTSCSYGIYRLGDAKGSPGKLDLLRTDLETALGDTIKGKTLTVSNYALYLNSGDTMRGTTFAITLFGGIVGSLWAPHIGSGCSSDETPEGGYDASEVSSDASPLIAQLTASLDGKSYSVRVVQTPSGDAITASDDAVQAYAAILHRANQALADKIAGRFGPATEEAIANFVPPASNAKSYASMLPFGIGTAAPVDAGSTVAVNFLQDPHGVAISALESDGAAARAGIRTGDVITEIDGARIDTVADLQSSIAHAPGSDVDIQLNRSGKLMAVQVRL
jgi:hypothetical protein